MKLTKIFTISFFVLGLIGSLFWTNFCIYETENILTSQIENNLKNLTQSHAIHIQTFLKDRKDKVVAFSFDYFIASHVKEINERAYSEEIAQIISEHLLSHKITEDSDFYEVFILDKGGKVVGTTDFEGKSVEDFSEDVFFLEGKKGAYMGDFSYEKEFNRKGMIISAPLLLEDEPVGVVVFRMSIDGLVSLIKNIKSPNEINPLGVGESGDIYLVNNERLLITPSRFLKGGARGVLLQEVDDENVRNCFRMKEPMKHEGHEGAIYFLNYLGEEVIGTHEIIPEVNWCLLVEISKSEAIDAPVRQILKKNIFISLMAVIILTLIGFFVGTFLDKKYLLNKRIIKAYPCGFQGNLKPFYCRLTGAMCHTYPHGRCGKYQETRQFFAKLKLRYYILLAIIFTIAYFLIITSFFQGWQNAKLFDDVPDLLILIAAFIIFIYAFRLKNIEARQYMALGAGFICLQRLIEVPLQEYQAMTGILDPLYWIPVTIIGFLGFLFLLLSFKKIIK